MIDKIYVKFDFINDYYKLLAENYKFKKSQRNDFIFGFYTGIIISINAFCLLVITGLIKWVNV